MTIVRGSFCSMVMHRWTSPLEDSLIRGEKMYGRGVGVVVARVVNDSSIQCLGPDDGGGGRLTAPVFIHHYFPSISRQSRVFVNEAA